MERNRDLFWKSIEPEHVRARGFCRKLMGNREDGDDLYQTGDGLGLDPSSEKASMELPDEYQLSQNYPNPFNPTT